MLRNRQLLGTTRRDKPNIYMQFVGSVIRPSSLVNIYQGLEKSSAFPAPFLQTAKAPPPTASMKNLLLVAGKTEQMFHISFPSRSLLTGAVTLKVSVSPSVVWVSHSS